ncbi:MAG: hypothetical protein RL621_314 [Bacteroidota bacterium]|jgi:hypothetical protein
MMTIHNWNNGFLHAARAWDCHEKNIWTLEDVLVLKDVEITNSLKFKRGNTYDVCDIFFDLGKSTITYTFWKDKNKMGTDDLPTCMFTVDLYWGI